MTPSHARVRCYDGQADRRHRASPGLSRGYDRTVVVTEVLAVDPARPEPDVIARAAAVIRAGGLVAFPTETVYGLGGDATNPAAVRAIFATKERAKDDPLIVHLASAAGLEEVAAEVPELAALLAGAFWPGPLTLVVKRKGSIAPEVSAGLGTVAVRVPAHPVARALIEAAGVPIAAPSANRFMRTSATTAAHVMEDLGGRIAMVLDGGPAPLGVESTVVSVEGETVHVLRHGGVTMEELQSLLAGRPGARVVSGGPTGAPKASPGMLARHYAPRARLLYITGSDDERTAAAFAALVARQVANGARVGVLAASEDLAGLPAGVLVEDAGPRADLAGVAGRLFSALRSLDARGAEVIVVRCFPLEGIGMAINDRLTRAAAEVIEA
jgi:L-threonylcarbamoyladenylate synthase